MPDTTALVIGKFLPPHRGHLALIRYARQHSDSLIVLLGARPHEPIPGPVRLEWLCSACAAMDGVRVEYTDADLPSAPRSDRGVSRVWADYLRDRYPQVSLIVSSETYGDYLAEYMGIRHLPFDPSRGTIPVAGRDILADPVGHWDDILSPARDYFRRQVCIYGPESTGKTTLASALAEHFGCPWVPEMARELLGDRHVVYEDILPIAMLHARTILEARHKAGPLLLVDTDHLTTRIYSRHYFGRVPDFPPYVEEANTYTHYLFLDIDVPWVADPQRDSADCRETHRAAFLSALGSRSLPYTLIRGSWEERFEKAKQVINHLLLYNIDTL